MQYLEPQHRLGRASDVHFSDEERYRPMVPLTESTLQCEPSDQ